MPWVDGLSHLIWKRETINYKHINISERLNEVMNEKITQYFDYIIRVGNSHPYARLTIKNHFMLISVTHPTVKSFLATLPGVNSWLVEPAEQPTDPLVSQFRFVKLEEREQSAAVNEKVRAESLAYLIEGLDGANERLKIAKDLFSRPRIIDNLIGLLNHDPLLLDQQNSLQENAARTRYYLTSLLCSLYADPASHFYMLQTMRRTPQLAQALISQVDKQIVNEQGRLSEMTYKLVRRNQRLVKAYAPAIKQELETGQNFQEYCHQQEILTPEENLFISNVLELNKTEDKVLSREEQNDLLNQAKQAGLVLTFDGKAITPNINEEELEKIIINPPKANNVIGLKPLITIDQNADGDIVGFHFPIHSFYSRDLEHWNYDGISIFPRKSNMTKTTRLVLEIDQMERVEKISVNFNTTVVIHQAGNEDLSGQTDSQAINTIYFKNGDGKIVIDRLLQPIGYVYFDHYNSSLEIRQPVCREAALLIRRGAIEPGNTKPLIFYDIKGQPFIVTKEMIVFTHGQKEANFTGRQLSRTVELILSQYPIDQRTEKQRAELAEVFANIDSQAPALISDTRDGKTGQPLIYLPVNVNIKPEIKTQSVLAVHEFSGDKYTIVETPVLAEANLTFIRGATEFSQLDCQGKVEVESNALVYIKDGNIRHLTIFGGVVVVSEQMLLEGKIQTIEFSDIYSTNSLIVVDKEGQFV